ncbi:hypothetical protein VTJ04DRAFT_6926 [Mycothermus thermophilus]|uniref:uncharacterized protein n=1 Tax=Humicola insolens TaxID=85995 RepID=UPI0037424D66
MSASVPGGGAATGGRLAGLYAQISQVGPGDKRGPAVLPRPIMMREASGSRPAARCWSIRSPLLCHFHLQTSLLHQTQLQRKPQEQRLSHKIQTHNFTSPTPPNHTHQPSKCLAAAVTASLRRATAAPAALALAANKFSMTR